MKFRFAAIFLLLIAFSFSNRNTRSSSGYPQDYFSSPLEVPLLLSGSFGELRSNHFHSGIDFKTQQREGLNVLAAADGHVSRIKVSPWGFGNALYVDHPNGYTTVYAHLQRFNDTIREYVKRQQYRKKSFAIELFPGRAFPVKRGEVIALSGNTGGSGGPHLHFEIRDTKSEYPLNPLLFNFKVPDTKAPEIRSVKLYPLTPESFLRIYYDYPANKTLFVNSKSVKIPVRQNNKGYYLHNIKKIQALGTVGVAVETLDYHDGSWNRLGVYCIELQHNDKSKYIMRMEKFGFHQTRYLNSHIDYEEKERSGEKYQKTFVDPGNFLEIYDSLENRGRIDISSDSLHHINLTITDAYSNLSVLQFDIERDTLGPVSEPVQKFEGCLKTMPYQVENFLEMNEIRMTIPAFTFYDTVCFQYQELPLPGKSYSSLHQVHNQYTPLQKYYNISLKVKELPEQYQNKAIIMNQSSSGRRSSQGGNWDNGYVTTRTRSFGKFYIDVDTVPPKINALNIHNNADMKYKRNIQIRVNDNLSGLNAGNGYIDGEWVLMEYDGKLNLFTHTFEKNLAAGKHTFLFVAKDEKSNESRVSYNFVR
ncbi:MAG: M23 family metallopeptidase [Bacteroidia bacterium]